MKEVVITYCKPCGYIKQADKTANELKDKLKINATLVAGKGGIFVVAVDGKVVARKTRAGFPGNEEIVAAVSAEINEIS